VLGGPAKADAPADLEKEEHSKEQARDEREGGQ
jgi:hypothetical protein